MFVFYEDIIDDWVPELRRMAAFIGDPERADDPRVQEAVGEFLETWGRTAALAVERDNLARDNQARAAERDNRVRENQAQAASDPRLDRDLATKLLPEAFAADREPSSAAVWKLFSAM